MKKMAEKKFIKKSPVRISPVEQAVKCLDDSEAARQLRIALEPLRDEFREDFCLGVVAYLRIGVRRRFTNDVMNVMLEAYCDMLDETGLTNLK